MSASTSSSTHAAGDPRLLALIENLPFDVWSCDRDGRYVLQNATSKRRWGDRTGKRPEDLALPRDVLERWVDNNARAMRGEVVRGEIELTVDGEVGTYFNIVAPIRTAEGISGIVGVNLDITDRKLAERERDRLVVELQRSVAQLRDTQEELVRRERFAAVGEAAALLAHEIRNPLAAIVSSIASLRRLCPETEDTAVLLGVMRDEANRIERTVHTLLDLTRPMRVSLVPNSLPHAVEDALAAALRAFPPEEVARVAVARAIDPDLPEVLFDSQWLHMALVNLITNAIQAMKGGGTLRVSVARRAATPSSAAPSSEVAHPRAPVAPPPPAWAAVTIEDTGAGIPAAVRDRVFDPFVTTRALGTGLGLAVVKRVVAAHGGAIDLRTEEGKGTAITLRLPLHP